MSQTSKPVERAAEAVRAQVAWEHPGVTIPDAEGKRIARAAIEAALSDREGLADLIESAQTDWSMTWKSQGKSLADYTADAIATYLLTGAES